MTSLPELESLRQLAEKFQCRVTEQIPEEWFDRELTSDLSVDFLRSVPFLPLRVDDEVLLACVDPAVESRVPELRVILKGEVEPILVPEDVLLASIDRCFTRKTDSGSEMVDSDTAVSIQDDREDLLRQSTDAPVAAKVSRLLLDGLEQGASDIHLEPHGNQLEVRFRIDGVLSPQTDIDHGFEDAVVSRIKIMARLDIAERRLPQDGNAKVRVGNREVDIRVSCLPVADGERLVLRLLGRESTHFSLAELGMPEPVMNGFRGLLKNPHGVIWVTGPTGSGKTTTLYAALQELDTVRRNVLTIEDPVEYQLPGIGQMAVQPRIGLTFAAGLRSILRQDPDVILVGETRDEETADIVMRASMTGHLVLSTLHANDSISASLRLTDMGVEPFLVAEATRGAMAQRLVRVLCPQCSTPDLSPDLPLALKHVDAAGIKKAVGCPKCREGYVGRRGLFELLRVDETLRGLIREHASAEQLRSAALKGEFQDLWKSGGAFLTNGKTTCEELHMVLGEGE
ncbi:GspE/PulE family protein [Kiritimatiellaeota bacterium B1221]|nr:GspE/PulE family protein [Kiritimatiellaeota bacterium B1221]